VHVAFPTAKPLLPACSTGIKASLELSLARDQQGGDGQAGGLSRAKAEARTAVEAAARALKEELAQVGEVESVMAVHDGVCTMWSSMAV
jgi:hypothetical protein